ncbi:MAG: hypothetical protein MUF08_00475 [Burkholderiaceae bacterium]|jgi:hypothetical protein|nr:hypothetical protein [Burkholderiaceae bacterium]
MNKVYVGDTGTVIVLDCGQDVSAATVRSIEVMKPDGTLLSWSAALSGTNAIAYTSQANTFDTPGKWQLQAKVTLPSGVWRGATARLVVYPAFG